MSNKVYNQLWHDAQKDLEEITGLDFTNQALDPDFERSRVQTDIYELYIRYILISNKLEDIYDQLVQPQKRMLVRKLLDGCLGRVLELKNDLVEIDMMEFNYNDNVIDRLCLTPDDIELKIPRYFRRENDVIINERKGFIDKVLIKLGWLEESEQHAQLTELEAIKIIQSHERARQGRLRAHFMKEIRFLKEKTSSGLRDRGDSGLIAAMRIQKVWRGFATRKKTRRRKLEEMMLIGMVPSTNSRIPELRNALEQIKDRRYKIQSEYHSLYEKALVEIKDDISTRHSIHIGDHIGDEIRNWFKDSYEKTMKLPELPSEDHGGSRYLLSRQGTESEISKSSAVSSKDSKRGKEKGRSGNKLSEQATEEEVITGYKASQSVFLPEIKSGVEEFNSVWAKKNEFKNFRQKHYDDIIYSEKYDEVETEIRKVIDDLMRKELEILQSALDRDRASKGKKPKKSSKKTRRSGKKSKKKKEKDLTPDRTTESLFEELVMNGIIRKCPEKYLNSYLGEISFVARSGLNPTPGDVRQVITQYCVLPLGSEVIRLQAPCIRSVLLTGPKGSGKKSLVHAICTEVGGTFFDLTPSNIVGKYPGKTGLIMLVHLVTKVARLLQPSIIYMGDAERPFMKKVPKGDKTDPKRLKKDLGRIIKNIGPEDRVIFIGTSNSPWDADQKLLQQIYSKFIYIPRPDYGVLSFAWKQLLSVYTGFSVQSFDTGAMAKVSDGYTIGSVVKCIKDVLTCKRSLQLKKNPLTHLELINSLSILEPVYREEEEAFINWWSKTPLGRRYQRTIELEIEMRKEKENSEDKKKKKKKKTG